MQKFDVAMKINSDRAVNMFFGEEDKKFVPRSTFRQWNNAGKMQHFSIDSAMSDVGFVHENINPFAASLDEKCHNQLIAKLAKDNEEQRRKF